LYSIHQNGEHEFSLRLARPGLSVNLEILVIGQNIYLNNNHCSVLSLLLVQRKSRANTKLVANTPVNGATFGDRELRSEMDVSAMHTQNDQGRAGVKILASNDGSSSLCMVSNEKKVISEVKTPVRIVQQITIFIGDGIFLACCTEYGG
jgi:hypothetical protein